VRKTEREHKSLSSASAVSEEHDAARSVSGCWRCFKGTNIARKKKKKCHAPQKQRRKSGSLLNFENFLTMAQSKAHDGKGK
jgi:hypothetical protein